MKEKKTGNINAIAEEFIWEDAAGLITKELGKSVGSGKLYANMDSIPPGAYSTKYHSHSQQEEFFYVLQGTGTLRFNDRITEVKPGDFICKPSGDKDAHTFYNSGADNLLILDIGTVEKEDICYYPDEDVYMVKSNDDRMIIRKEALTHDWDSEPNKND